MVLLPSSLSRPPTLKANASSRVRRDGTGAELARRRLQSRSTPGHGLGLSLVAAVVRHHQAELYVFDNAPGLTVEVRFRMTHEHLARLPSSAEL